MEWSVYYSKVKNLYQLSKGINPEVVTIAQFINFDMAYQYVQLMNKVPSK